VDNMKKTVFDFSEKNGLVFCNEPSKAQNNYEVLHIYEASGLKADAIFFRRYYKENEGAEKEQLPYYSEPAVYIFQRDKNFTNSEENIELHARIWSAGKSEIYIILTNTSVDIINARKPARIDQSEKLSIADLILASDAIKNFNYQRFSAYLFASGTFWEQGDFYDRTKDKKFFNNKLEEENMPYHQLLAFLKHTRRYLQKDKSLSIDTEIIDKLLIICILMKFLEEIKDDTGAHTLSQIYQKKGVADFADALVKGKSIAILEILGKKFNGRIFDYFTDRLEAESDALHKKRNDKIKDELRKANLSSIARLLQIRMDKQTGQLEFELGTNQIKLDLGFRWQQYSFRFLPIELISSIYEHFLQEDAKEQKGEEERVLSTPHLF